MAAVAHPEYLGVHCATCGEDCLPLPNGRCGFCDSPVDATAPRPEPMEVTRVDICKIDGCDNPSADSSNRSVRGLCQQHIREEMVRRAAKRRGAAPKKAVRPIPKPPPVAVNGNGSYVGKVERLQLLAERIDALRADLAAAETAWREAIGELVA